MGDAKRRKQRDPNFGKPSPEDASAIIFNEMFGLDIPVKQDCPLLRDALLDPEGEEMVLKWLVEKHGDAAKTIIYTNAEFMPQSADELWEKARQLIDHPTQSECI